MFSFFHRNRNATWGRPRPVVILAIISLLLLLLAACKPAFLDPPRLATETAQEVVMATPAPPLDLPAPTPTGPAGEIAETAANSTTSIAPNPALIFWGKKGSTAEAVAQQAIANEFSAQSGVNVELFLVEPELLPDLMQTAVVSSAYPMPHVVMLPLEYTVGWAEEGVLDIGTTTQVMTILEQETFDPAALELVQVGGGLAALPSDGWQQLLLYRTDWFAEQNLPPPLDYSAIISAGQAISNSIELINGFNMPTESSLVATTRAFEQLAIANGCQLVDEKGELQILTPACQDALEMYRFLCNSFCPPGVQTEVSTRNAYLAGRVGMIMAPPSVLPMLAGLDPANLPTCTDCTSATYLAENTGIVTQFRGRGNGATSANLGNATYLGITNAADEEIAAAFAQYWFNDGYMTWIGSAPEMKVPLRRGTPEEPLRFIREWATLPLRAGGANLTDLFGESVANDLSTNILDSSRWGFRQGYGGLVSQIYEDLHFSILLQELLSGYYNSNRAAIEGYKRLVELIPNYAFYVDPEPTPSPEP
jgi:multiple sugar transport system substrate-binding protein